MRKFFEGLLLFAPLIAVLFLVGFAFFIAKPLIPSQLELKHTYGDMVDTIKVDKISLYRKDPYNPESSEVMFVDGTLCSYVITYAELKAILQ